MTPSDYFILVFGGVGLLVCIAGFISTFIPPDYLRKRKR